MKNKVNAERVFTRKKKRVFLVRIKVTGENQAL